MHVVHVIRDLDSVSGGPSRSLPALLRGLTRVNPNMRLAAVFQDRGNDITIRPNEESNVEFTPLAGGSPGPFRVRKHLDRVHRQQQIDVIHLHGLWSPSIHLAAGLARRHGIPYIISPRGMLSAWCLNNKSIRKRIAWWSYQQRDLQRADCIHATSGDEADDIRSTLAAPPIAMIPHGCELPPIGYTKKRSDSPLAVCITRIHPVKGLADLIDAWANVHPPGWQLVIAGPDSNGYAAQLRQQISRQQLDHSVRLSGAVDGKEKWDLLSEADLFLSASHSENFGMSIAESLAAGTPVITTQGTPWESVIDHRCGWWVPIGVDGLAAAIREATSLHSGDLLAMGKRGSDLITSQFSWDVIAGRMLNVYRWLLDRSIDMPAEIQSGRD